MAASSYPQFTLRYEAMNRKAQRYENPHTERREWKRFAWLASGTRQTALVAWRHNRVK